MNASDVMMPLLASGDPLLVEQGLALLERSASAEVYEKLLEGMKIPERTEWRTGDLHLSHQIRVATLEAGMLARLAVMRAVLETDIATPSVARYREALRGIRKLVLNLPPLFQDLGALASLPQLEALMLDRGSLLDFSFLKALPALRTLEFYHSDFIGDLDSLANNRSLERVGLCYCENLTDISAVAQLPNLKELYLDNCPRVRGHDVLGSLTELRELQLNHYVPPDPPAEGRTLDFTQLEAVPWLGRLASLEAMAFEHCEVLSDIGGIASLRRLASLSLTGCVSLASLRGLEGLASLKSLTIQSCGDITDFAPLEHLRELQALSLGSCRSLSSVSFLRHLPNLRHLTITDCRRLADISALCDLPGLTELFLDMDAAANVDLQPLQDLGRLTSLHLGRNRRLASLEFIRQMPMLRELAVPGSLRLTDITAVADHPALTTLDLSNCPSVTTAAALWSTPLLDHLHLDSRCGLPFAEVRELKRNKPQLLISW